jgi:hypothetical protein
MSVGDFYIINNVIMSFSYSNASIKAPSAAIRNLDVSTIRILPKEGGELSDIFDAVKKDIGLTQEQIDLLSIFASAEGKNIPINEDGTFATNIGHTYTVESKTDEVLITNANDAPLCQLTPAGQVGFVANTSTCKTSTQNCTITEVFRAAAFIQLSGGGINMSNLPAGYLAAEFLESTGTQHMNTGVNAKGTLTTSVTVLTRVWDGSNNTNIVFGVNTSEYGYFLSLNYNKGNDTTEKQGAYGYGSPSAILIVSPKNALNTKYDFVWQKNILKRNGQLCANPDQKDFNTGYPILLFARRESNGSVGRSSKVIYLFSIAEDGKALLNYIPALDNNGSPCMFDTVTKKPFYNSGTGQFIAGFTLPQARKLGKLPAGTKLAVSLPVGYASDDGVVAALAEAESNGCVLTVQTYEAAGAAATFALRRVWVRKTQDENGNYVNADGVRYRVEWCEEVLGAEPEALGYEPFRSVEAAREYWGLVPYVDPAWEDELMVSE